MRRGGPKAPPELVGGLAAAFALARLGIDPCVAQTARVRIGRPRCLDAGPWPDEVAAEPDLMLLAADEAEPIAEELIAPVTGGQGDEGADREGAGTDQGGDRDAGRGSQAPGLSAGACMVGDVAASARAAVRALSRHRRGMRAW